MWTIKCTKLKHFDCFTGLIVSYAESIGIDYQIAIMNWKFEYYNNNQLTLGNRIGCGETDKLFAKLHYFYGIDIHTKNSVSINGIKNLIINSPLILSLDAYHCPWCAAYKSFHRHHNILINDCDNDGIYCIDSYFPSENNRFLAWNEINSYKKIFTINHNFNYIKFNSINIKKHLELLKNKNIIPNLICFKNDLENCKNFNNETQSDKNGFVTAPIISNLKEIADNRYFFSNALEYISYILSNNEFTDLITSFNRCGILYDNLKNNIIKSIIINNINHTVLDTETSKIIQCERELMGLYNNILSKIS